MIKAYIWDDAPNIISKSMGSVGCKNGFIWSLKSRINRNGPANCNGTTKNHIIMFCRHLFLKYERGKVTIANAKMQHKRCIDIFMKRFVNNPKYNGWLQTAVSASGTANG